MLGVRCAACCDALGARQQRHRGVASGGGVSAPPKPPHNPQQGRARARARTHIFKGARACAMCRCGGRLLACVAPGTWHSLELECGCGFGVVHQAQARTRAASYSHSTRAWAWATPTTTTPILLSLSLSCPCSLLPSHSHSHSHSYPYPYLQHNPKPQTPTPNPPAPQPFLPSLLLSSRHLPSISMSPSPSSLSLSLSPSPPHSSTAEPQQHRHLWPFFLILETSTSIMTIASYPGWSPFPLSRARYRSSLFLPEYV